MERENMEKIIQFSREIGSLDSRIGALERRVDDRIVGLERQLEGVKQQLERQLSDMQKRQDLSSQKLDVLMDLVQAGRVSWRTVAAMGGVVATVAVVVSWAIENLPRLGVI